MIPYFISCVAALFSVIFVKRQTGLTFYMLITARVRVTKHAGANHIGGFKPGYIAKDIGGEYATLWPATTLPP